MDFRRDICFDHPEILNDVEVCCERTVVNRALCVLKGVVSRPIPATCSTFVITPMETIMNSARPR